MSYRKQPTPEQKEKAELRRKKFRELAKSISALTEEQRAEMASRLPAVATIEGRVLSVFNQCLLASQFPSVTIVGGFRQWKAAGRFVRKGSQGLSLWIPLKGRSEEPEKTELEGSADSESRPSFIMGTVFDVSQTEPAGSSSSSSEPEALAS
jgi:N-terminal domain of anti-restriction factor ArdC